MLVLTKFEFMKKLLLALFLSVFSYIAYAPCLNFEAEEMTQLKLKHNLLVQISPTLDKIKYSENVQNIPLISPLDTCYLDRITSNFGYRQHPVLGCYLFHTGVDLSSPIGTTVVSTANGYVTEIGKHKYGYGNYVIINHENGYMTRYAHLKSIIVKPGQRVTVSQPIGISVR